MNYFNISDFIQIDRIKWHEESLSSVPPDLESILSTSSLVFHCNCEYIFHIYLIYVYYLDGKLKY